MDAMREEALRFGANVRTDDVPAVSISSPVKSVTVGDETPHARALCSHQGAAARHRGVPHEQDLIAMASAPVPPGTGSFSTTKTFAVVGGDDSAMEEATFLTCFMRKVARIRRRNEFRASKIILGRALSNDKVALLTTPS